MVLQSSTACDFGAQADICEDFASTFYTAGAQGGSVGMALTPRPPRGPREEPWMEGCWSQTDISPKRASAGLFLRANELRAAREFVCFFQQASGRVQWCEFGIVFLGCCPPEVITDPAVIRTWWKKVGRSIGAVTIGPVGLEGFSFHVAS